MEKTYWNLIRIIENSLNKESNNPKVKKLLCLMISEFYKNGLLDSAIIHGICDISCSSGIKDLRWNFLHEFVKKNEKLIKEIGEINNVKTHK